MDATEGTGAASGERRGGDTLDLLILSPYPQLAFEGPRPALQFQSPVSPLNETSQSAGSFPMGTGSRPSECLPAVCMSLCCPCRLLSLWPVFPGKLVEHALRPGPALLSFHLLDPCGRCVDRHNTCWPVLGGLGLCRGAGSGTCCPDSPVLAWRAP